MAKPRAELVIADGTLEAMKWLAVVLMTLDHVNRFLLYGLYPWMFELGRGAMPLFTFVLAAQCQRSNVVAAWTPRATSANAATLDPEFWSGLRDRRFAPRRMLQRMLLTGTLASIPYGYLLQVRLAVPLVLPLNVMFSLALSCVALWWLSYGRPRSKVQTCATLGAGLVLGALVDYFWLVPLMTIAMSAWLRQPNWLTATWMLIATTALWLVNATPMALWVMPLILAAAYVRVPLPRCSHCFYIYYPAHLALIALYLLLQAAH